LDAGSPKVLRKLVSMNTSLFVLEGFFRRAGRLGRIGGGVRNKGLGNWKIRDGVTIVLG
jgi:hypothetical protein